MNQELNESCYAIFYLRSTINYLPRKCLEWRRLVYYFQPSPSCHLLCRTSWQNHEDHVLNLLSLVHHLKTTVQVFPNHKSLLIHIAYRRNTSRDITFSLSWHQVKGNKFHSQKAGIYWTEWLHKHYCKLHPHHASNTNQQ
jgi:hypothetical protein